MTNITVTAFIFHKGKMLLVFHKKLGKWMHPGGHVEVNEFFDEALRREIREEVSLEIEFIDVNKTINEKTGPKLWTAPRPFSVNNELLDGKRKIAIDYICIVKEPVKVNLQKSELLKYRWVREHELKKLKTFSILKHLGARAFKEYNKLGI